MRKLWAILEALRAGKELANVETWKHVQGAATALFVVFKAVSLFLDPSFRPTDVELQDLAGHAAEFVGGLFVLYLTYSTSSRVGLPNRSEPLDSKDDDGRGDGRSSPANYRGDSEG